MELLSQKIRQGNLIIEVKVHDLSYRMGFRPDEEPFDHLYVELVGRDDSGRKMWTTPILTGEGKVQPYSTVTEALTDARRRISEAEVHPKE